MDTNITPITPEQRAARWGLFAKIAVFAIGGLLFYKIAVATVVGMIGLIVAAVIGALFIAFLPIVGRLVSIYRLNEDATTAANEAVDRCYPNPT
jgi:Flp pilus assembly protein TadB